MNKNWSLPSAISQYRASVFLTSLPHSTLSITASFLVDLLLGLASLGQIYPGFHLTYLPVHVLLKNSSRPPHSLTVTLRNPPWIHPRYSIYHPLTTPSVN